MSALPARAILDEIQRVPELLRTLKLAVDRDRRPGRFVLTGSANLLLLRGLGDSLAGRMEVVQLQPLTAAEQARAPGRFLGALLAGRLRPAITLSTPCAPLVLAERIVAGGFPEAVRRPPPAPAPGIASTCAHCWSATCRTSRGSATPPRWGACWRCWRCARASC